MRAMLWKELRENARWAVLGAVGLALAAAFGFAQMRGSFGGGSSNASGGLLPWLTFGAPLIGVALGLLQILPEQRRDQWAFLVHRPVSRDAIFAGKAVAGLTLYALATLVPTLGALVWASEPGHLAMPFDWRLGLPALADIGAGVAFYFAGLVTALRPARWYGSRALPVTVAVIGSLLVLGMQEFWQAALCAVLFAVPFAVAAWGCFRTTGEYGRLPGVSKLALGLVLYAGIILAIAASIALVSSFTDTSSTPQHETYYRYGITRQEQILSIADRDSQRTATDLAGHPVAPALAKDDNLLSSEMPIAYDAPVSEGGRRPNYRETDRFYRVLIAGSYSDDTWFYVYRTHRLVGYNDEKRRLTTVGGRDSFVPATKPLPAPFVDDPLQSQDNYNNTTDYLAFPHTVYALDLANQRITRLATLAPPEHIRSFNGLATFGRIGNPATHFALQTDTLTRALSGDGRLLFALPRFLDAAHWYEQGEINCLPNAQHYFFWYRPGDCAPRALIAKLPRTIVETDAHGHELKRDTLPALPVTHYQETAIAGPEVSALLPPGAVAAFCAIAYHYRHAPQDGTFAGVMGETARNYTQFRGVYRRLIAASLAWGLLASVLAVLIGRRCAWGRQAILAWAFGAFWLGLYGVLLILALDAWPARQLCPNCGKRRIVTRTHCEHCGAEFTVPAPDGTEIFDAAGA